jgi:hypothetical protein
VAYACCGHGYADQEYVVADGVRYSSVEEWRQTHGHTSGVYR